jgi:hypothetical protein
VPVPIFELPIVNIPVGKHVKTYINITSTCTVLLTCLPISLILISSCHVELPMPLLQIVVPLPIVNISIRVLVNPVIGPLPILPISLISVSISILDHSISVLLIV